MARVFISGGTGYLGEALIPALLERGHSVHALARRRSQHKLARGAKAVLGDALDAATFVGWIPPADTFIHLVGVSKPSPWKEQQFRAIDLASVRASTQAALTAGVRHFVYVSVAQPAPVMQAYITVRAECEAILAATGLNTTLLRPWYVLGPGHRWPWLLAPFYRLLELIPSTRASAMRLGLVTRAQMIAALVWAVEHPPPETRIMDVPAIRRGLL